MNWTAIYAGTDAGGSTFNENVRVYSITYGNGTFIAGSGNGSMARSTNNGIDWSSIPAGIDEGGNSFILNWHQIYGIAYGNSTFIAAASSQGRMARSTDYGLTWKAIPVVLNSGNTSPFLNGFQGIAYGNGIFIAVGNGGRMLRSADYGETWTAIHAGSDMGGTTFPLTSDIRDIAYGNDVFIAVGNRGRMARSTDYGITWIAIPDGVDGSTFSSDGDYNGVITDIAYGNGTFIAVSTRGRMARSTDYGVTWIAIPAGINGSTFSSDYYEGDISTISFGNNIFIAGGNRGRMAFSINNGVTWTAIPVGTGTGGNTFPQQLIGFIRGIAYGNGTFIAGGDNGRMARSTVSQ
jgi:photosystem II stability/assembly factor-like uncharacterized protein